jgi:L-amino acid N-acyltransferase
MMTSEMSIRPATEDDLDRVITIFNHYVETSTCTFNLEPYTREEYLNSFRARTEKLPLIVAEIGGAAVGWAGLSQWRRAGTAYSRSVEGSVYVDKDHHRKGIGMKLTVHLIALAKTLGHKTMIGGACTEQEASLALQKKLGFESVGVFRNVGYKFDRWLDVEHTQLMLSDD